MDASDLELALALARAYPRLAAALAVVVILAGLVLALASVRPSEAWALAHPRAFTLIRLARAVAPYLRKAGDLLAEARKDGTMSATRAFFERGRAPTPVPPAPAADAPAPRDGEGGAA